VTWRRFNGAEGEQRARPSPGAFWGVCREKRVKTRNGVRASACSPSEGRRRRLFVYDRRRRDGAEKVEAWKELWRSSRFTSFDLSVE